MNNKRLWILIKGELQRLNKYGMITVSLLVAVIWGAILYFLSVDALNSVLPFILLIDATMMSLMYMGAEMFFEKSESTISTMLVTPAKNNELILSKVIANVIHNLFSSGLIIIVFVIIRDVQLNYIWMIVGLIIANALFTLLGLVLAYNQKDFTSMLVNVMLLAFLLIVPSALYQFGILKAAAWEYILLINPVQAANELIQSGFQSYVFNYKFYVSISYLVIAFILLYRFIALPKFQEYAIRQSGV